MRSYVSLTGTGNAFGWGKRMPAGDWTVTMSGLIPQGKYLLAGKTEIAADASGRWAGRAESMPLYVALLPSGTVVLYDEERLTLEEAVLLARPERTQKTPEKPHKEQVTASPEPARTEKITYRTRLGAEAVDALPPLIWPTGKEKIQACFEKSKPVLVLPLPWRFAAVPGTRGMGCVGYYAAQGRVIKTAYAVRAKGGLFQPRELTGYQYIRGADGNGYWMLIEQAGATAGEYAH